MPIFEYQCRVCGTEQEHVVIGREKVYCINCESFDLEKKMSAFSSRVRERQPGATSNDLKPVQKPTYGTAKTSSCGHKESTCSGDYVDGLIQKAKKNGILS